MTCSLDENIDCVGPKVVSRRLTLSHIRSVNELFQRRVTIWDNLNANDYDQRRLCLGPFSGRSTSIAPELNGLLINPNCEFELNFVALNTLGQWIRSLPVDQCDTSIDQVDSWLQSALVDWLPELNAETADTTTDDNPSKLTIDELTLLVHLFYLPYEHGWRAQQMFNEFQWLRIHHHGSTPVSD